MQSIAASVSATAGAGAGTAQAAVANPYANAFRERIQASQSEKLARLMVQAGILKQSELIEAMEIAESLKQSVDQIILSSDYLPVELKKCCEQALHYVDSGKCNEQLAANGLAMASRKKIAFVDGLKYFGYGW